MKWLALLVCVVVSVLSASAGSRVDSLMRVLDGVVVRRPVYHAEKEAELAAIRHRCDHARTDDELYQGLMELFGAYSYYSADSALAVSQRMEALARNTGNVDQRINARLNTAEVLAKTGMFSEAQQILESMNSGDVPDHLKPYLFHLRRTVYGYLSEFSAIGALRDHYMEIVELYRDSLLTENEPGTLAYTLHEAGHLSAVGRHGDAIEVMRGFADTAQLSDHDRALIAWSLAEAYGIEGDTVAMKENLLVASIGDLRSATREYVSVQHLAMQLFREGDLERAYRLLNIAIEDALTCNARLRTLEINNDYSEINAIYIAKIRSQQRSLWWLVALISLLVAVLAYALVRLRRQVGEVSRQRLKVAQSNSQLTELNAELETANATLKEANRAIAENSRLKEAYIGKYMDQCLAYMDRLEKYRKTLVKLDNAGKHEELRRAIRSTAAAEDELKSFYQTFDDTFLSLFPTFVSDFNSLLQPGEAIEPKKSGTLTTELRIFALIRLGITDSDRISRFLGYSVTTIYNYRTRVRNKAAGDRALLEEKVQDIGRPD